MLSKIDFEKANVLINYPTPLILVQLFNAFIRLVIFCALLGFFFTKFKGITDE